MKLYEVRYYTKDGHPVTTAVSNYMDLSGLLKGEAKHSKVETRISGGMPVTMHNLCGKHNSEIEKQLNQ